jgi:hypothetical protein
MVDKTLVKKPIIKKRLLVKDNRAGNATQAALTCCVKKAWTWWNRHFDYSFKHLCNFPHGGSERWIFLNTPESNHQKPL